MSSIIRKSKSQITRKIIVPTIGNIIAIMGRIRISAISAHVMITYVPRYIEIAHANSFSPHIAFSILSIVSPEWWSLCQESSKLVTAWNKYNLYALSVLNLNVCSHIRAVPWNDTLIKGTNTRQMILIRTSCRVVGPQRWIVLIICATK